jgi:hypothetical protein
LLEGVGFLVINHPKVCYPFLRCVIHVGTVS